ncbi:MAG: hypothetical protein OXH52_03420 [Gammaproteobacteria bacterium]|nr:hypothetical protein [Gammaproteobacteria bacterium]
MARRERVNVKAILADPDLRRKLMVRTIQATQAREGIETTEAQAERAYYVVTESERTAFFTLERSQAEEVDEAGGRHGLFVRALSGELKQIRFDVRRRDFGAIESSPLAYRQLGVVAQVFREAVPLEAEWGIARQGKATADDTRWVRCFWETANAPTWIPFAKGGSFCRFYSDVYLRIDWKEEHRDALRASGNGLPSLRHYFRPGLTWPLRTQRGFNLRVMPQGCIFGHKGPTIFPTREQDAWFLLGLANSAPAEYLLKGLMAFGSWEVGVIKRLPVPQASARVREAVGAMAREIHDAKATWDECNEISTYFERPWLIRDRTQLTLGERLKQAAKHEAAEETRIRGLYDALNDEAYRVYGIPDDARAIVDRTLGERAPEVIWPQMERRTPEQKRMEHVWRLLSYVVKKVVEEDADGLVPFAPLSGETSLLDRVHQEMAVLFPEQHVNHVEVELANELKRRVKGYKPAGSIGEWLENVYFGYHVALYKKRPIFWHVASRQGNAPFAFGVLCHYHRFDANRMAKLRATYLRHAMETFRREAALADREGRADDRIEMQARLEETQALDGRLQAIQEGNHEGPEGGDRDYRILTPWKSADNRPTGWVPDIDDGVKVNIGPLQKAGVLRIAKVV